MLGLICVRSTLIENCYKRSNRVFIYFPATLVPEPQVGPQHHFLSIPAQRLWCLDEVDGTYSTGGLWVDAGGAIKVDP